MTLSPTLQRQVRKHRKTFRELPSLVHLGIFVLFVLLSVMSFNFEVFRVIRVGDLFLLFFAFMIGVQWYGQKMLEEGYRNAMKEAREAAKNKRK